MTAPTAKSGHPVPDAQTPLAPAITARLAMASLRVHSHTERMLLSPLRWRKRITADNRLVARARMPTLPLIAALGSDP